MGDLLTRPWVVRLARYGIGAVFAFAALAKIGDVDAFSKQVHAFELVPVALENVIAMTVPWIELVAALALFAGVRARGAALLTLAMMIVFTAAVGVAAARGLTIDCGCFGSVAPEPVGLGKVLQNVGFTAVAVVASLRPR